MNGHGNDERSRLEAGLAVVVPSEHEGPTETDLIFDFSETQSLDVKTLSLMLTAQQAAMRDAKTVWVAGLPQQIWNVLRAMGLDGYFRAFPGHEEASA